MPSVASMVGIAVWTVNDARLYEQLQRWPVDLIISDYPAGPP